MNRPPAHIMGYRIDSRLRTMHFGREYNVGAGSHDAAGRITYTGGVGMKFYTIKLPKFLGGFVRAILNTFHKN